VNSGAYPKASRYFAKHVDEGRPLFQGDIFRGGFGAFWRHPATQRAQLAGQLVPQDPPYPSEIELRQTAWIRGTGFAMLLPQPCEFSESEKGSTHPFRLVAPVLPLNVDAGVDHDKVRQGLVGHTVWVPRWTTSGTQDYFVNLRLTTSIDATFLTRKTRVAALSSSAWMVLADRLSRYFVGMPLDAAAFAVGQAALHPDATLREVTG
jgi:hypothetical protein